MIGLEIMADQQSQKAEFLFNAESRLSSCQLAILYAFLISCQPIVQYSGFRSVQSITSLHSCPTTNRVRNTRLILSSYLVIKHPKRLQVSRFYTYNAM